MFDSITIGASGSPLAKVDAGFLAECLLFYKKVRIVAGAEVFRTLVRTCGAEELLELCNMGSLSISFLENMTMILSVETNVGTCHDLGFVSSVHTQLPQIARKVAEEESGGSGRKANLLFSKLNKLVERSQYDEEAIRGSRDDLKNQSYLEQSVGRALSYLVPEYALPDKILFRPQNVPKFGIRYDTNIDFAEANAHYHRRVSPADASLNPAFLLAQITGAEADIIVASRNGTEFAVDPLKSIIVSSRVADVIEKSRAGKEKIEIFKEVLVHNTRSVSDAVNSGDKNFREVIRLVQQADKFKDWIQERDDDASLRDEYCKDVSSVDWADKLPAKSARFVVMTGLSVLAGLVMTPAVGIASGIGLNAADYFLLDRLVKGWKPNQFLEGPLKAFTRKD